MCYMALLLTDVQEDFFALCQFGPAFGPLAAVHEVMNPFDLFRATFNSYFD